MNSGSIPVGRTRLEAALGGLLLVIAVAIATGRMSDHYRDSLDDAYITYLYGKHLAGGHGLRYNAGDPSPIEGFSSLLHVLWSAAAYALGVDPLTATRAAGPLLLVLVALAWASVWVRRHGLTRRAAGWGAGVLAVALSLLPETAVHLASGMETLLFAAVSSLAYAWYWDALWAERLGRNHGALGVLLVAALLIARPEGVLIVAVMGAGLWVGRIPMEGLRPSPALVALGLGSIGLLAGFVLWKLSYFGDWAPLPYYVKSHNALYGSAGVALPGLRDVATFTLARLLPLGLLAAALLGSFALSCRRRLLVFLLPVAVSLLSYTRVIHEVTPGYRYEYPQLWPVLALAALGLARRAQSLSWPVPPLGVASLLALALIYGVPDEQAPPWRWLRAPAEALSAWARSPLGGALGAVGADLRATGVEGALVATNAAGLIPLRSGWATLDLIGLNDPVLSGRRPITPEQAFTYIDERRPDVVASILPPATPGSTSAGDEPLFEHEVGRIALRGAFNALHPYWDPQRVGQMVYGEMAYLRDHYEFGAAYRVAGPWFIVSYVRKDSPHRTRIHAALSVSERPDRTSDLAAFYVNDPRGLGATP